MFTTDSSEIMKIPEVAEFLKVSESTVYKLVKDGELPAKRVRGQWRIRRRSLDEYLAATDEGKPAVQAPGTESLEDLVA
jgi:excisionase family DNA binding protein